MAIENTYTENPGMENSETKDTGTKIAVTGNCGTENPWAEILGTEMLRMGPIEFWSQIN